MFRLAALALSVLMIGCNVEQRIWVSEPGECSTEPGESYENLCEGKFAFVASDFSQEDTIAILDGFQAINDFLGKDIMSLTLVDKPQAMCNIRAAFIKEDHIGFYHADGNIDLDSSKVHNYDTMRQLVIHESLHSLGFTHRAGDNAGIMCSNIDGRELNEDDRAQARELGIL